MARGRKPAATPDVQLPNFVPLDCNKPAFQHLRTTTRRFDTLVLPRPSDIVGKDSQ
jgi:hypothetical protein